MAIVKTVRNENRPLTYNEIDDNFDNLNSSKIERVVTVNDSSDGVRITQTGTGNAVKVEDSTNPDSTPFVIAADGAVGIGIEPPQAKVHIHGTGQTTQNLSDAGLRTDILKITTDNTAANSGGAIAFGNSQGNAANSLGFAAIKGLLVNGSGNTTGNISFQTRLNPTDTTLVERMRIESSGSIIVSGNIGTTGNITPSGTVTAGSLVSNGNVTARGNLEVFGGTGSTKVQIAYDEQGGQIYIVDDASSGSGILVDNSFGGSRFVRTGNGVGQAFYGTFNAGATNILVGGQTRYQYNPNGVNYASVSGYGGLYPTYECRAWVRFSSGGLIGGGNISSVQRLAVGVYRINLVAPMPDTLYNIVCSGSFANGAVHDAQVLSEDAATNAAIGTNSFVVKFKTLGLGYSDVTKGHVAIFR